MASGDEVGAVPYASGVRNTGGTTWEFVLNEGADEVTIARDGGSPITLSSPTAGRYTFDMAGFTGFDIDVSKTAASGWTTISDESNLYTSFLLPNGLAINNDPTNPLFGTIYVANGIPGDSGGAATRPTGDGIYALTADMMGVDFSTPAWTVPTADDITAAKVGAGWEIGDFGGSGNNSPYRISLDDSGNVIVGDFSDANGGLKYLAGDLTGGGLVLDGQGIDISKYGHVDPNGPFDGSGSPFVHGGFKGVPNVTGTVGVDLVVRAMDQHLNRNPTGVFDGTYPDTSLPDTDDSGDAFDGNHVWKWTLGSETNSLIKPELLIDVGQDEGQLGADSSGRQLAFDQNNGVRADAEFFPQLGSNGLWVLTEPRFNGDESGIVIVEVDESNDNALNVVWSSRQWTIDSGIDGYPNDPVDAPVTGSGEDPNSDVFRNTGTVDVSPDGTKLYVHRWFVDDPNNEFVGFVDGNDETNVNPWVGENTPYGGRVLVLDLDSNGVPTVTVDDNGTPGDTSDDFLVNIDSIEAYEPAAQTARREVHEVEVDAAGNVYITDNIGDMLQVFSPGGETLTRFSFDGTNRSFAVIDPNGGLPGDYNGDGTVNAADYTVWRDGNSPDDTQGGYDLWANNYGATATATSSVSVPEPSSVLLAIGAAFACSAARRRI